MTDKGYKGYVTIHSKWHGPIRGKDKYGSSTCHAFEYQVEPPLDITTGHASGKRQHNPIKITKEWGDATPQLFQAVWSNEVLESVVIQFVDQDGKPPKKHSLRIQLANAIV